MKIGTERTLLQETVDRLAPLLSVSDVYVVSGSPYVELVRQQLPDLKEHQIIVEPLPRNTAPCIGFSSLIMHQELADDLVVVLPSDHIIRDVEQFHGVLKSAEVMAREGHLVTFGLQPTFPATGYGYVQLGQRLGDFLGRAGYRVLRFTEKPNLERATRFLAEGGYFWNSGMFVWSLDTILGEMENLAPGLYNGLLRIQENWQDRATAHDVFEGLESISIDYAIMEKSERVATIPCDLGWSDVGSWKALREVCSEDSLGVVANTEYEAVEGRDCVVFTENAKFVGLIGVKDLVIVETENALLVCAADRTEEVSRLVKNLRDKGRQGLL
jgi:mannose-1-phosphate guanylyltransferase